MNLPIEFWIILTALVSSVLTALALRLVTSAKHRRLEQATWSAAERYYKRRYQVRDSQI